MYIFPFLLFSCGGNNADRESAYQSKGRKVEILAHNGEYTLYRDGEPYFIKGAAGYEHFDRVKAYGGNSVRVWHTEDAQKVLDRAQAHGLTVTLGLWMAREREGFNYYDKEEVQKQLQELKQIVLRFKDHPALLMWGVGNELYADGANVKVWNAVNEVAVMIHEVDPDHPTTTTVMNVPHKVVNLINARCPAIDVLSINSFGAMVNLRQELEQTDWKGPYIISEFGGRGYWEAYTTWWYAPIEQTSSEKAAFARERYLSTVAADTGRCLGSYVFLWGYKYETTPTWFSLVSEGGEETELMGVMRELWTGKPKQNKAPYIAYLQVDSAFASDNVYLKPSGEYTSNVYTFDPEGDSLNLRWELLPETVSEDGNSIKEEKPAPLPDAFQQASGSTVRLKAPGKKGPYRLYVYVYDGQGNVSTANFPFYVGDRPTKPFEKKKTGLLSLFP
ncbi:glycoside hydrolase family 2 TIM barrel-domain containing protein [Pontibacter ruber]|uniref:Glycoside hydrolase family 2 TIM barrel-domain containing protein n=1 Tax=Pontibacter ruber TaxID=1343895 RepID=A0ABW5CUC7_9BACT|nr:glycoside hydrolase family 2 TIM barrel-domain containing protein [Pontibacter ruber]